MYLIKHTASTIANLGEDRSLLGHSWQSWYHNHGNTAFPMPDQWSSHAAHEQASQTGSLMKDTEREK